MRRFVACDGLADDLPLSGAPTVKIDLKVKRGHSQYGWPHALNYGTSPLAPGLE